MSEKEVSNEEVSTEVPDEMEPTIETVYTKKWQDAQRNAGLSEYVITEILNRREFFYDDVGTYSCIVDSFDGFTAAGILDTPKTRKDEVCIVWIYIVGTDKHSDEVFEAANFMLPFETAEEELDYCLNAVFAQYKEVTLWVKDDAAVLKDAIDASESRN